MKISDYYRLTKEIREKNKNGYSIDDLKSEYPPDLVNYLSKLKVIK